MSGRTAFSISDLSSELGLSARAIRYYESLGLLAPERTSGRHRLYNRRDRARLRMIVRGRRLGFSLKEIADLLHLYDADPSQREQYDRGIQLARQHLETVRTRIAELMLLERDLVDALQAAETNFQAILPASAHQPGPRAASPAGPKNR
ncbi:MAG: MerR family transcriptional regulator [Thermaerobacter sp.]|nr:MerR family transcriptional regulator [Thermaerobacter sp.]